ncbi:MAG: methyltransferase domain-containing protein [Pseudomonadota bacterium]
MAQNQAAIDDDKLHEFVQQVFTDVAAAAGGAMVSLGHKLGLYQALADEGGGTSEAIARRAGCAERYVREWLNSQVAAGYVSFDPETARYSLSPEQAMVLANPESPVFLPMAFEVPATLWLDEDKAIDAFRSGRGVPWGEHHERLFCGTASFFRNGYQANLVSEWLPALDGMVERLERGARVADVGCGFGYSTTLMAQAFPNSTFHGFDNHAPSIEAARDLARREGLEDRVTFTEATAKSIPQEQPFDLVCFFDCLHDMGDPLGAARHARESLAPDGRVMLVEPRAGDQLEENVGPVGRMYYSASTVLCCAHSLSEEVGTALGAQAGEARLGEVFREAGFSDFRRATETPFNLILEARP